MVNIKRGRITFENICLRCRADCPNKGTKYNPVGDTSDKCFKTDLNRFLCWSSTQ